MLALVYLQGGWVYDCFRSMQYAACGVPWVSEAFLALLSLSYYTLLASVLFSPLVSGLWPTILTKACRERPGVRAVLILIKNFLVMNIKWIPFLIAILSTNFIYFHENV